MNKQQRIKAAKAVALAIESRIPHEEWIEQDKALVAEGCSLSRMKRPGCYAYADGDGTTHLTLVVKRKQVVAYDAAAFLEFVTLDRKLAGAKTQQDVYEVACKLDEAKLPASLARIIEEGIERTIKSEFWGEPSPDADAHIEAYRVETPFDEAPEAPASEEPKPAKPKKAKGAKAAKPKREPYVSQAMRDLAGTFEGVAFTCKGEGCCIWAEADKERHGEALEAVGFVWSGKKGAYYRRAA